MLATAAGAGIQPRQRFIDKDIENAYRKSLLRYVFSAGESFGLGDRELGIASIPQARLALLDNFTHQVPNLSDEYIIKGNGGPFINYTKSAYDCATEITSAFTFEGTPAVFVIEALTGKEPDLVIEIERVLLPELPPTLKALASYLKTESVTNIQNAGMPTEIRAIAEAAREQLYNATVSTINFQNRYLDRSERELINSRKPNGHGKSSLDDRDRHFYRMLQRPVPKEADLEYVAEKEGAESTEQTALAAAIEKLSDRLDSENKVKSLEEQVASLTALVEKLLKKQPKASE